MRVRRVRRPAEFIFAQITISTDEANEVTIDARSLKLTLLRSLKMVHGDFGLASTIDVVSVNNGTKSALLRISARHYVHVRSAVSLLTEYNGTGCHINMDRAAYSLCSLAH